MREPERQMSRGEKGAFFFSRVPGAEDIWGNVVFQEYATRYAMHLCAMCHVHVMMLAQQSALVPRGAVLLYKVINHAQESDI